MGEGCCPYIKDFPGEVGAFELHCEAAGHPLQTEPDEGIAIGGGEHRRRCPSLEHNALS
jgi:hypothetical protein